MRSRRIPKVHIKVEQDGRFQIVGIDAWQSYWRDPYHLMLTVPWPGFLVIIALGYVAINTLFALLYLAGGDCIANAQPGSFTDKFFFSVQTIASIGYGAMYPQTTYAHTIVTIESLTGIVGIAVLTGLAFARFSRATARVLFSRVAIVVPHDGTPTFMFRAANLRRNHILEAQLRVYLLRDEVTVEGNAMRRIYDLNLVRHRTPSFSLTWTAMHPIDEQSPLYGMTPEALADANTTFVISLSGLDITVAQTVHARHDYTAQEVLWNTQFVDIIHRTPEGHRYIDYNRFHDVEPLDIDVPVYTSDLR
jgi:inward rectifier potassium channel